MAVMIIDPEDTSGITYRLDGTTVRAFQFGVEVDRFRLPDGTPEGLEVVAVLARHHDTMTLGE